MKNRYEHIEEANRIYDQFIDELVNRFKTDMEEEDEEED